MENKKISKSEKSLIVGGSRLIQTADNKWIARADSGVVVDIVAETFEEALRKAIDFLRLQGDDPDKLSVHFLSDR